MSTEQSMAGMTTLSSGAGAMNDDMAVRTKARPISPKVYSLAFLIVFTALWEGGVRTFHVPSWLIPPVSDIAIAMWRGFATGPFARDGFWFHSFVTILETVLGYLVGCGLGLGLGVAISQTETLEAALRPFIVAFQSLPKVAVAPIIVLWLGFGLASKVAIVALLTFFPVLVTALAGFKAVEPERIELLRSLSASRWHIFTKVKFWTALPFIFAGLEMAAAFAVVGAIVGEFVGAQSGLGVLILQLDSAMDVGGSFAVFVILSLIGIALSAIIRALENRVLYWQPKQQTQRTINL
jgi:NitT/TauT family transport system permease protein